MWFVYSDFPIEHTSFK